MEKIKDKVILITGATGSIGSATAQLLAGSGGKLFLSGRNESRLKEVGKICQVPDERLFQADLAQETAVEAMAKAILDQAGPVDILINLSGIGIIKPLENLSSAEFKKTIDTNLIAPFLLMKYFLPQMKQQNKGLVIQVPGVLGKTPMAGAMAYAASKYGLNGMMKSLREELKRTNIRITQLFLGGTDSRFWDTIDLKVQRDKMILAEEAAKSIWFLCQQPLSGVVSEMVVQPFNHQAI
jgi:short-subunit dehydrogenase